VIADINNTLTRREIADAIHRQTDLPPVQSRGMVDAILTSMQQALARGESVKISGFGTFLLHDKAARIGRNPKTGVEAEITARRVVTFRASSKLKDRL